MSDLESQASADSSPKKSLFNTIALDLTPLKISRNYRLLFIGQFVSIFGSMVSYVVLPWQMYQLTKSSFAVGLLGVAEFVPMFFFAFIGGALADYVDRKKLIWFTELAMAVCISLLILNSLLSTPKVWILFLFSIIFAALVALQRPSREALTPRILPLEHMPAASALNVLRYNFGSIAGPALGGIIVAKFGAAWAYSIDLITFGISLSTLWMMNVEISQELNTNRPSLRTIIEGLRYARSRQELLGTYLIDLNAMFFGMPMALFPAIAESFGKASVGLFYAMPSVGALLATLTSGWTKQIHKHGLAITIAATIWGIAIIGFGFAPSLWLALFFLILAGAADNVSGLFRMTVWNQTIPNNLRGRLAGIEMISYMAGPMLGNAEAGLVAGLFSLSTSVISGGILCVIGSGVLALLLPKFISYDSRKL